MGEVLVGETKKNRRIVSGVENLITRVESAPKRTMSAHGAEELVTLSRLATVRRMGHRGEENLEFQGAEVEVLEVSVEVGTADMDRAWMRRNKDMPRC